MWAPAQVNFPKKLLSEVETLRIVCVLLGRGYADFTQIDLFLIFVPPHEVLKYSDEWLVVLRTSYYFSFFVLFCTPPPIVIQIQIQSNLNLNQPLINHTIIIYYVVTRNDSIGGRLLFLHRFPTTSGNSHPLY